MMYDMPIFIDVCGQEILLAIFGHEGDSMQGGMGKTHPSLTHQVKAGLNHAEKPTNVGKIGFINFSLQFLS